MALVRNSVFLLLLTWYMSHAQADGLFSGFRSIKFSSEIVVPLAGASKSNATSAAESRRKARSAASDAPPVISSPVIVIAPEPEEEGVLSPSRMSSPADNRTKAKEYSRGLTPSNGTTVQLLTDTPSDTLDANQSNLEKNRNKARQYADGGIGSGAKPGTYIKLGTSTGVIGKDGVVVFVCEETNNTVGRIGDDTQSGNIFSVLVNGKLVKARCK